MGIGMEQRVLELLESYAERERKIAVLRYNLEHPTKVSRVEQIEAMNYERRGETGGIKGHVSDKTLYIALNYEERAEHLDTVVTKEFADELFELERQQKRLVYYVGLLEKRQADIVRLIYMEGLSTKDVADRYALTYRTIDRIKSAAVRSLAEMYAYSDHFGI